MDMKAGRVGKETSWWWCRCRGLKSQFRVGLAFLTKRKLLLLERDALTQMVTPTATCDEHVWLGGRIIDMESRDVLS